MNDTSGFRRRRPGGDRPGPCFLRTRSEEGQQVQQSISCPDQAGEAGFLQPKLGQEHDLVLGVQLRDFGFDGGRDNDMRGAFLGGPRRHGLSMPVACRSFALGDVAHIEYRL